MWCLERNRRTCKMFVFWNKFLNIIYFKCSLLFSCANPGFTCYRVLSFSTLIAKLSLWNTDNCKTPKLQMAQSEHKGCVDRLINGQTTQISSRKAWESISSRKQEIFMFFLPSVTRTSIFCSLQH